MSAASYLTDRCDPHNVIYRTVTNADPSVESCALENPTYSCGTCHHVSQVNIAPLSHDGDYREGPTCLITNDSHDAGAASILLKVT